MSPKCNAKAYYLLLPLFAFLVQFKHHLQLRNFQSQLGFNFTSSARKTDLETERRSRNQSFSSPITFNASVKSQALNDLFLNQTENLLSQPPLDQVKNEGYTRFKGLPQDLTKNRNAIKLLRKCEKPKCKTFYTHTRSDRSGASIFEMLTAHAYASFLGYEYTYGGACGDSIFMDTFLSAIEALGLKDDLVFNAPVCANVTEECYLYEKLSCLRRGIAISMTPEWKDYIQSKVYRHLGLEPKEKSGNNETTVAVHVRRQDITPCAKKYKTRERYDPNQHYLDVLDEYVDKNASVTMYSMANPYEPFTVFEERNYSIVLGGSIQETWKRILEADTFVMSRSSFSLVPAVLHRGKVIFTRFLYSNSTTDSIIPYAGSLPEWTVVNDNIMTRTWVEHALLQQNCTKRRIRR